MSIDANALRKLAETADGLRNQDLVLVERDGVHMVVAVGSVQSADNQLIALRTDGGDQGIERPTFEIELQIEGGPDVALRENSDAIFWSLSAVDKFVLPYYARIWSMTTVLALRAKLASDSAWLALRHPPGSTSSVLRFTVEHGYQDLTVAEYLSMDARQL